MITASERATELNAITQARADAEGWGFYGLLATDSEGWAECGVHTGEDLDRYLAFCDYVDLYKELRNVKPRWLKPSDHTAEAWVRMTQDLHDDA